MLEPSYRMFAVYAEMFEAAPVRVPFAGDLSLERDALVNAIGPDTRLVMIANPNQPTGTQLDDETITAVLARAGEAGALVVIDEAYHPFSATTALPLLAEHPQLVITRTFSKAWGLAGPAPGLVAADAEVIGNLFKVRSVYDANALAVTPRDSSSRIPRSRRTTLARWTPGASCWPNAAARSARRHSRARRTSCRSASARWSRPMSRSSVCARGATWSVDRMPRPASPTASASRLGRRR